jgi:hypothetical protein
VPIVLVAIVPVPVVLVVALGNGPVHRPRALPGRPPRPPSGTGVPVRPVRERTVQE